MKTVEECILAVLSRYFHIGCRFTRLVLMGLVYSTASS